MLGWLCRQNLALLEAPDMKLSIIALIFLMLGLAAATTNYTQDAQAFTRPISFLNNVTFHGPISTEGPITGTTINASDGFTGDLTGTASRVPIGTFLDTEYGLKNTSNKIRVNLTTNAGLEFGTGATEGALTLDPSDASLTLAAGGVSVRSGLIKRTLAAGTASATDVTISSMAVGDELISVTSYTTAAAIASMADRTSEYVIGAGKLVKAAGTDESNNQLDILWLDRTA
jgi:hypothetical protein